MLSRSRGPQFAAGLEAWGDAPALIDRVQGVISYADLARRADEFAARLPPSVRLLSVELASEAEPVIAYLAALRAGVPVALCSGPRVDALADCRPDAVLARANDGWRLRVEPRPWAEPPHAALALLMSTSGSVGGAKLVKLSRDNLQSNAEAIGQYLRLGPDERAVTSLPLAYSYGLSILNSHLAAGAAVVLTDASVADPEFRELIERHGVTSLAGVPYSYELMRRSGLLDDLPATVRTLTQAGGAMAPEMVARVAEAACAHGADFFVMYGQTEATARIAYLPTSRVGDNVGAIGGPIPGGELWLEDDAGRRVADGEQGELVYRGPNVMMGYAARRADLAAGPGSDVLRTGDMAVRTAPRMFRITGRKSRFVKPFGLRIGLDDLERKFRAAGAPVTVAGDDRLIVALGPARRERAVRKVFADLGLPAEALQFVPMASAPRLQNGKPDYLEILRLGRERQAAAAREVRGFGPVEALFRSVARGPVAETASFQTLGGDSLSYVQCALSIEEALGELPESWETLTLGELRLRAAQREAPTGRPQWMTVESDVLVRCGAMLTVLFHHAMGGLMGGSDVLLMLAGYSWSRFQRPRLTAGQAKPVLQDFGRRYLLLYLAIILAVSALNRKLAVTHLAFVSTYFSDWGGILNTYWFIESLTWCVVAVCVASLAAPIRRWMHADPFRFALAFVAVALGVRLLGAQVHDVVAEARRTPDQTLVYFAIGWALAPAGRLARIALLAMLVTLSASAWGPGDSHVIAMAAAATVFLLGRAYLPRLLGWAVTMIASASFYIYLVNPLPMYVTDQLLHAQHGRFWTWQILGTIAAGVAIYLGVQALGRRSEAAGRSPMSSRAAA